MSEWSTEQRGSKRTDPEYDDAPASGASFVTLGADAVGEPTSWAYTLGDASHADPFDLTDLAGGLLSVPVEPGLYLVTAVIGMISAVVGTPRVEIGSDDNGNDFVVAGTGPNQSFTAQFQMAEGDPGIYFGVPAAITATWGMLTLTKLA